MWDFERETIRGPFNFTGPHVATGIVMLAPLHGKGWVREEGRKEGKLNKLLSGSLGHTRKQKVGTDEKDVGISHAGCT